MTGSALGIVLIAAFLHAFWNYLAKKSRNKIAFIWWSILFSVILFLPMFLYYWPAATISSGGWSCIVATGILHAFYFWFMGRAYERGDLSLVYPLARGSGPLFVPILAVLLLCWGLANYILENLVAMGHGVEAISGGRLNFMQGVLLLVGVMLIYESLGGMRSVAWTDVVQGSLLLVGYVGYLVWRTMAE